MRRRSGPSAAAAARPSPALRCRAGGGGRRGAAGTAPAAWGERGRGGAGAGAGARCSVLGAPCRGRSALGGRGGQSPDCCEGPAQLSAARPREISGRAVRDPPRPVRTAPGRGAAGPDIPSVRPPRWPRRRPRAAGIGEYRRCSFHLRPSRAAGRGSRGSGSGAALPSRRAVPGGAQRGPGCAAGHSGARFRAQRVRRPVSPVPHSAVPLRPLCGRRICVVSVISRPPSRPAESG